MQTTRMDTIDGESNVDDVMTRHPETVSVFLRRRMHCPGCLAARFETLDDVCRIYGISLQPLLVELRTAAGQEGARR